MATGKNDQANGALQDALALVRSAHSGMEQLMMEWRHIGEELPPNNPLSHDHSKFVLVTRSDMERLVTEVMQMKEFLPKVLNSKYIQAQKTLVQMELELQKVTREKDKLIDENEQLQQRTDMLIINYEKEKQENLTMKHQVNELTQQLNQQADYCASMGYACCSLLWRVSQQEQAVEAMLAKSNVGEFLELVGSTLQSYLATYNDEPPAEDSEETQFVLSLCGTVTNIAASAYGRDYLAKKCEGQTLINLYCKTLSDTPMNSSCARLRNFILMTLYNISLNQSGLHLISSQPNLIGVLSWLLQEENDVWNKLNTLRLIQSILIEPINSTLIHEALEMIPFTYLQQLSTSSNADLASVAMDILADLKSLRANIDGQHRMERES